MFNSAVCVFWGPLMPRGVGVCRYYCLQRRLVLQIVVGSPLLPRRWGPAHERQHRLEGRRSRPGHFRHGFGRFGRLGTQRSPVGYPTIPGWVPNDLWLGTQRSLVGYPTISGWVPNDPWLGTQPCFRSSVKAGRPESPRKRIDSVAAEDIIGANYKTTNTACPKPLCATRRRGASRHNP